MNTLTEQQFKGIIKDLPSTIDVELEFDGEEGFFECTGNELEANGFFLVSDFTVREAGSYFSGDQFTPSYFVSSGRTAFVSDIVIYDRDDEEINLQPEQFQKLTKKIESILESEQTS